MTAPVIQLRSYRPDLADALEAFRAPTYRHSQVYHHMMRHPGAPFATATDLPLDLRHALEPLGASTLQVVERQDDPDGTTKLLLKATADGVAVETVVMR